MGLVFSLVLFILQMMLCVQNSFHGLYVDYYIQWREIVFAPFLVSFNEDKKYNPALACSMWTSNFPLIFKSKSKFNEYSSSVSLLPYPEMITVRLVKSK